MYLNDFICKPLLFYIISEFTPFVIAKKTSNVLEYRKKGGLIMEKYICTVCGYVYDPEIGDVENDVEPGTAFADLPEDWVCPVCAVGKEHFEIQED